MSPKVKVGDILTVYPSKNRVKVIVVTAKKITFKELDEQLNELSWLKNYWRKKHGIILPMAFRIITCRFTTTYKEYDYPLYRKCVRKPFRQKKLKKKWENERKDILNAKVSRMKSPSDYTMYQMGF